MSDQPNVITPNHLDAIEEGARLAARNARDAGRTADGTVLMLCAALRVAWGDRNQAEFRATILQAQLGGWEAACALQVSVLQDVPKYVSVVPYDLERRIEEATETNAGQLLLSRLALAQTLAIAARRWLAQSGIDSDDRALLEAVEAWEASAK
jgi:hypothetical protein